MVYGGEEGERERAWREEGRRRELESSRGRGEGEGEGGGEDIGISGDVLHEACEFDGK